MEDNLDLLFLVLGERITDVEHRDDLREQDNQHDRTVGGNKS